MHEQAERLYSAAKDKRGITRQSELARALNVSSQTVKNWETRGVSKQGMLDAQKEFGCSATWIETGVGDLRNADDFQKGVEIENSLRRIHAVSVIVEALKANREALAQGNADLADIALTVVNQLYGGKEVAVDLHRICATTEECEILYAFRALNEEGKGKLLEQADFFLQKHRKGENVEPIPVARRANGVL